MGMARILGSEPFPPLGTPPCPLQPGGSCPTGTLPPTQPAVSLPLISALLRLASSSGKPSLLPDLGVSLFYPPLLLTLHNVRFCYLQGECLNNEDSVSLPTSVSLGL